jgi:rRNA-processing protein FCF1
MDADCLIKLTKAGLKGIVCENFPIFIPRIVEVEVVEEGKKKGCADAFAVEQNIAADRLSIIASKKSTYPNGDRAVISLFNKNQYDAVATDDARLLRQLKHLDIPYILPGLILLRLNQKGILNREASYKALKRLEAFISSDEFSTVYLLLSSN